MPRRSAPTSVRRLKITLDESDPPIWRRVEVASGTTLADLHAVIQTAMGWWNEHLHEYEIGGERFGSVENDDWGDPPIDERTTRLSTVAPAGTTINYQYDFGDGWDHTIVVEAVDGPEAGAVYPRCIAGARACPPEDSGGVWGYVNLLAALADPTHPEHQNYRSWVGGDLDPEGFDLDTVNEALADN